MFRDEKRMFRHLGDISPAARILRIYYYGTKSDDKLKFSIPEILRFLHVCYQVPISLVERKCPLSLLLELFNLITCLMVYASQFFASELEFLGHTVNNSRICLSLKHTLAIWDETIQFEEDISRFLKLLHFSQSFILSAAKLLQLLTELIKKAANFCCGEDQEKAFNQCFRSGSESLETDPYQNKTGPKHCI